MKSKPWQIALIVLGLLVGGGSVVYSLLTSSKVPVANVIHCVDVETGDLYRIDFPVVLPARHPSTGRVCLVRVKNENGKWFVSGRDLETLRMLDKDVVNKVVDEHSGDVRGEMKSPLPYPRKK